MEKDYNFKGNKSGFLAHIATVPTDVLLGFSEDYYHLRSMCKRKAENVTQETLKESLSLISRPLHAVRKELLKRGIRSHEGTAADGTKRTIYENLPFSTFNLAEFYAKKNMITADYLPKREIAVK